MKTKKHKHKHENVYLQRQKSRMNPQIKLQKINIDHIRLGSSASYPPIYTIT